MQQCRRSFFSWEDPRISHFKQSERTWGDGRTEEGGGLGKGGRQRGGIEEGGWGTFVDV